MGLDLIKIVEGLGHPRILVIGDVILDRYVWGNAERISQEAPVILLREDKTEDRLGGAANVANMLRGLEAQVTIASALGGDEPGLRLRSALESGGIDCGALIVDADRPTTMKQRYIGRAQQRHPHQILRVDREVRTPISSSVADELLGRILDAIPDYQAILISDYAKGVCTPKVLARTIDAARRAGVPVIVDPCPSADYANYRRATAITPNRLETATATGLEIKSPEQAFEAGNMLCQQLELDYALVTLDSDGIALTTSGGSSELLPTRVREVYDITGAGDMVLATIGVTAAAGIEPRDQARLANIAGGLEVEQIGVAIISREEIVADLISVSRGTETKIQQLKELCGRIAARRQKGQRVVFTNGCFDLLHVGHVTYLQQAACHGDCLVVALNSDDSVRSLNKAPGRPLFPEHYRATMLAALDCVDYVTVFDEATPESLIRALRPDVLVKGGDYTEQDIVGREIVQEYGGTVQLLGLVPEVSTTQILARLRQIDTEQAATEWGEPPLHRKAG